MKAIRFSSAIKKGVFGLLATALGLLVAGAALEFTFLLYYYAKDGDYIPDSRKFENDPNAFIAEITRSKDNCRYLGQCNLASQAVC